MEVFLIIAALVLATNFYFWRAEVLKLEDKIEALGCDAFFQNTYDMIIPSNVSGRYTVPEG